jgi:circadian clock protein KaiC
VTERVTSGAPSLDAVLYGGFPAAGISLILGAPGSGKTLLAEQCVFANASPQRPALYLSTVSEPLEKILRYGQRLSFFDVALLGEAVFYDDLGAPLHSGGLSGVFEHLRRMVRERSPGILVIDSMRALQTYAEGPRAFRRFLHDLAGLLSAYPVTTLWVGEYAEQDVFDAPEFAVADAIIALGTERAAERSNRALEVLKLRGGDFASGRHAYRLSSDGITVFPRLADPSDLSDYDLSEVRVSTGVRALDDMFHGGYRQGASTFLAGPTGVGKTTMGLHFAFEAARGGETAVLATFQEDLAELGRIARQFGWSLPDDRVALMYRSPVDLYVDQWVHELLAVISATGATRVLIDSIATLRSASPDRTRFREYLYSLLRRCARQGVSLMMTYEVSELSGLTRLDEDGLAHLVDNVVILQYQGLHAEPGQGPADDGSPSTVSRTLAVLKTRAASHDSQVRRFRITPAGITLVEQDAPALAANLKPGLAP